MMACEMEFGVVKWRIMMSDVKENSNLNAMQLERQLEILQIIKSKGIVKVTELSRHYGVSLNTIRRDLHRLEEQGLLQVSRGGAMGAPNPPMSAPLGQRGDQWTEEKNRIGRKACEFVGGGQAVILDAGTTTERMIPGLRGIQGLTVITNGLNIARGLSGLPGITTVLCGGILNEVTGSLAGFHAEEFMKQFHVATAFLSAGGVTVDGAANTNAFEVRIKHSMLEAAERAILLVAHDKIGRKAFAPFARLEEIDVVITDDDAPPGEVERLRAAGAEVILC
jgi:DeoR/GlpR family transcriptional regulator of sugar metabolism